MKWNEVLNHVRSGIASVSVLETPSFGTVHSIPKSNPKYQSHKFAFCWLQPQQFDRVRLRSLGTTPMVFILGKCRK